MAKIMYHIDYNFEQTFRGSRI